MVCKNRFLIAMLVTSLLLVGCQSNARSSAPSLLEDGILLKQKTVAVDSEHAKVILKPINGFFPVNFEMQRKGDPDERPESVGTAVYTGRGKVFGWIANMNETMHSAVFKHFPQLELQASPEQMIKISGSYFYTYSGILNTCGPVSSTFTPEKQKIYLVEFSIDKPGCSQHVYDITQPNQRLPVAAEKW